MERPNNGPVEKNDEVDLDDVVVYGESLLNVNEEVKREYRILADFHIEGGGVRIGPDTRISVH